MDDITIFTMGLGLKDPWYIVSIDFERGSVSKDLHITLGHRKRIKFMYEGEKCPVYDHQDRVWQHLDFFEHRCFLYASVPRVKTAKGRVGLVEVPWTQPGSSFTILFEDKMLELVRNGMNFSKAGSTLRIGRRRVFNVIKRRVFNALIAQPLRPVKELALDETSTTKGHNYFTIISDREEKKVVGIAIGKDKEAVNQSLLEMEVRGAYREEVSTVTLDMSRAYISAVNTFMPSASIVFDRYHIAKLMNEAVDKIRRCEQKKYSALKKTRYLWLQNSNKLKTEQEKRLNLLSSAYPQIGEAYRLKELLKDILDGAKKDSRLKWLNSWTKEAWASGLEPIQKFVNTLHRHWYGIRTYFKQVVTNAYAERVNLTIQEIKRKAKGFRNPNNYKIVIYFHLGGLDLSIPTK
jgi:transposase